MLSLDDERGFTLIELLTTLTILGVLAAVAISQFLGYQQRAFDARAENDLRKAITAEEAYYAENDNYVPCENSDCESELGQFTLSQGIEIDIEIVEDGEHYEAVAKHPSGGRVFHFDSSTSKYSYSTPT